MRDFPERAVPPPIRIAEDRHTSTKKEEDEARTGKERRAEKSLLGLANTSPFRIGESSDSRLSLRLVTKGGETTYAG